MSSYWIRRTCPGNNGSVKALFTWTIDNFLDRLESEPRLESPNFSVGKQGCEMTDWKITLYPKDSEDEDNIAVYISNLKNMSVKISLKASILDFNLEKHHATQKHKINCQGKGSVIIFWGKDKGLSRQTLKNEAASLLPGGQLTFHFELTVHHEASDDVSIKEKEDVNNSSKLKRIKEVGESFVKLLDDKDLTDMTIKCGAQDFPCHSLVLSARSQVFKAMFQASMKEREEREVIIEDIKPVVFAEMLHFIYTGETKGNTFEEIGIELLAAAEKYELLSLKEICEDNLCSGLTNSNAVQYLILGYLYKAFKLREKALKKVATNMASIVKTEAFKELKQYPDILIDILKVVAE